MSTIPATALRRVPIQGELASEAGETVKLGGFLNSIVLWLLSLFAFILPTDLRFANDKSIAMRIGYVCLLFGIVGVIKRRTAIVPSRGFWFLVGFVVWSSCTLAWAQYPGAAQHKVIAYWLLFAVTAIIPQYAWSYRNRVMLIDAYVYGCWLGVIGVMANFWTSTEYSADGPGEMEGRYSFGTDPNYLGLALVIGIPLALYRCGHVQSSWRKLPRILYPPAALAAVILTGSRGGLMALLTVVLAYGVLSSWRTRFAILGSAAVCLLVISLVPSGMSERFSTIPDELRHGTLSDRRDLWDKGKMVAKEHPLEGIGAGATTGKLEIAAHNTPLELMMEGGVVSLLLFYGALALGLVDSWTADRREARVMIAVCAAWIVGSFSLSWEVNTVSWFIFTLIFSAGSPHSISTRDLSADAYAIQSA